MFKRVLLENTELKKKVRVLEEERAAAALEPTLRHDADPTETPSLQGNEPDEITSNHILKK